MKAQLYSQDGKKKEDLSLPSLFDSKIREDLVMRYFEVEKFFLRQPYSSFEEAGKRHSASGTISHQRHQWKGHYGKGISRVPRKTMYRRGIQFFWIGAEVSSARGGRMAHPPKGIYKLRKINKKERIFALNSAMASTFNKELISKRYSSLENPMTSAVIESLPNKTKSLLESIKSIFGNNLDLLQKHKEVRSGKGKRRGRKYKSNSGLLIIVGKNEKVKSNSLEIKSFDELNIKDLYPLGRLTLYTKNALEGLGKQNAA